MTLEAFADASCGSFGASSQQRFRGSFQREAFTSTGFHDLPFGSAFFYLRPLTPKRFDVLALLPQASKHFHVLFSISVSFFCLRRRKENRFESWAGPSKREFSTKGSKLAASADGGTSSGTYFSAPDACNDLYWLSLLAYIYVFQCMCVCLSTYCTSDAYYDRVSMSSHFRF